MPQQTLEEILYGEQAPLPQRTPITATLVEDVAETQTQPDDHAIVRVQQQHSNERDVIAWMSREVDTLPDLDSYDASKAVSYDMDKIQWELYPGREFRFYLLAVQEVQKPDKLTRELRDMKTVLLQTKEKKIIHDSKAILVDKCEAILAVRSSPAPILVKYIGKKVTRSGFDIPDFDVKVLGV